MEFDEFFARYRHRLFTALCLTTGDRHEAEETTQDAFVRVLERWPAVSEMEDPGGYLFVTGMNLFRRRSTRSKVAAVIPVQRSSADSVFDAIDDRDVLVRALRALPPRQRAAIVDDGDPRRPVARGGQGLADQGLDRPHARCAGPLPDASDDR